MRTCRGTDLLLLPPPAEGPVIDSYAGTWASARFCSCAEDGEVDEVVARRCCCPGPIADDGVVAFACNSDDEGES